MVRTSTRHPGEGVHLRSPLRLCLVVNDAPLPPQDVPMAGEEGALSECILEIPAAYVTTNPLRVVVAGDHIAFGYWAYQ